MPRYIVEINVRYHADGSTVRQPVVIDTRTNAIVRAYRFMDDQHLAQATADALNDAEPDSVA